MDGPCSTLQPLGDTPFNYTDINADRFVQYYRQVDYALRSAPRKVLEIGPGDHTVTDYLRRKGVEVKTFDNESALHPDYFGDMRKAWPFDEEFDVILASKVFEHVKFHYLDGILAEASKKLRAGGHMIVALPYSTIRLFPHRCTYGRFVSCDGRVLTGIPFSWVQRIVTVVRGVYRFVVLRYTWKGSFRYYRIQEAPDDRFDVHHWDLGYRPTTPKDARRVFEKHFDVLEEKRFVRLNTMYFVLQKTE
ncbi:methyltransferase domain-containing protein [Candidatus Sumerlaeota bacterium]|nr:methyltransferase domain-containing protein [Candidatus Sumerlaeota bacterium]